MDPLDALELSATRLVTDWFQHEQPGYLDSHVHFCTDARLNREVIFKILFGLSDF